MRNRLTAIGAALAFWTFLALVFTPQTYIMNLRAPKPLEWWQAFASDGLLFYLWAGFTPLVFRLGKRFPLERPRLLRNLTILFLLGFPCAFLHLVLLYAGFNLTLGWTSNEDAHIPFTSLMVGTSATNVMIYWGVLIASQAIVYFSRYREREKSLAQAQLQSLKTQLNPHFLFNTLNAISELVYDDAKEAERTIAKLSELLRMTLRTEQAQEIPLHKELEFLRKYLEIQQTLLQDRLKVDYQIAPETYGACVPNMILQPLVENSIRHGIAPRRSGGTIKIAAARENGSLILSVEDDGLGMKNETGVGSDIDGSGVGSNGTGGIGLQNTMIRLKHLYGEQHEFEIKNLSEQSGVAVKIRLPFQENKRNYDESDTHFDS
ncbi:MAG TPA: histidine kinase [Pyrinomonadaceae bacterium]|nr:histidine kinase [Pyrinomonadaceae bacterium]